LKAKLRKPLDHKYDGKKSGRLDPAGDPGPLTAYADMSMMVLEGLSSKRGLGYRVPPHKIFL
jgi:hypothetical protein